MNLSQNSKVDISAEVGSVHDGSFGNAIKLIEYTKAMGADVIKFQTHISEAETLRNAPMPPAFKGEPRYEYFERTAFDESKWKEIKEKCDSEGIEFMSSPFSIEAVELLENLDMKRYKIPSGEVTNLPMLEVIAETKKQILLSTGMSSLAEIDDAISTINKYHNDIIILQCTSEYPCSLENVGLNMLEFFHEKYKFPVGFSDHTPNIYASLAAVSLGAIYIEKHFTYSKEMYGSDAKYGIEPNEFKSLIDGIREIEIIQNHMVDKDTLAKEKEDIKLIYEKSIVLKNDLKNGDTIKAEFIAFKKPGSGIKPKDLDKVINQKVNRDIKANTLLSLDDLL
jgi:N,N'-diacetyllegionaminate synthase